MKMLNREIGGGLIFYSVLLTIISVLVGWRIYCAIIPLIPNFSPLWIVIVYIIMIFMQLSGYSPFHNKITKVMSLIGNFWMCFQFVMLFASLFELVASLILVIFSKVIPLDIYAKYACIYYIIVFLVIILGMINARNIKVKSFDCNVTKSISNPGNNDRLKIAHISDLHLGTVNNSKMMKKMIEKINELDVDIVCLTGDVFTESVYEVFDLSEIEALFRTIKSKKGVYACLGNHDSGPNLPRMLDFFRNSNIRLLQDEHINIGNTTIIGRVDSSLGIKKNKDRCNIDDLIKAVDMDNLIITMDHEPSDIKSCSEAGVDILLSGHTHAGQFFPFMFFVKPVFPHYYGMKKSGKMYSFVSPGSCASVPPVRIGTRSEIFLINIKK